MPAREGVGDPVGQQGSALDAGDDARDEVFEPAIRGYEHDAGLRAELADSERERPDQSLREGLTARRERRRA